MNETISWETIEYLHREKTNDWYWIVGTITASIALIAIILNNVIFAILIIVSSFTLSLFASRKPEVITISIDGKGVSIGKHKYLYKELESFWVETRDPHPRVLLKSKKVFMPFVVAFIEEVEPETINEFLSNYLPEEEHSEPFLEKVLLYFGF